MACCQGSEKDVWAAATTVRRPAPEYNAMLNRVTKEDKGIAQAGNKLPLFSQVQKAYYIIGAVVNIIKR